MAYNRNLPKTTQNSARPHHTNPQGISVFSCQSNSHQAITMADSILQTKTQTQIDMYQHLKTTTTSGMLLNLMEKTGKLYSLFSFHSDLAWIISAYSTAIALILPHSSIACLQLV